MNRNELRSKFGEFESFEGLNMRSIWTRVRGYKADQVQSPPQESGGGEGAAEAQPEAAPSEQTKPVEILQEQKETPVDKNQANQEVAEEPKQSQEVPTASIEVGENTKETVTSAPVIPASTDSEKKTESSSPSQNGDWQQREQELLKKIEDLEKIKNERTEDGFKLELKVREEEIDLLKDRVKNLETELQAALSKPSGKNHEMIENIKQQHEELLSKARGMIFDKTKIVKNQELQIEALTTQVQSLKDINVITKDLLEIRNGEVKAMEDRLEAMEARFKAEKDRYGLVLQRAQTSSSLNDDLKKEYETQLAIFKELREKYEQRVRALVAENERLKASVTGAPST